MVLVFIITEFFSKHYVYILSMLYFRLDFRNGIAGPKYINFKNCNILQNYNTLHFSSEWERPFPHICAILDIFRVFFFFLTFANQIGEKCHCFYNISLITDKVG